MEIDQSFIDSNIQFGAAPGSGMPAAFNQNNATVTPEYLDQIIQNEAEHPEIRANAQKTKKQLFPHLCVPAEVVEEVIEQPQPAAVVTPPKKQPKKVAKKKVPTVAPVNIEIAEPPQDIPSKQITKNEFSSFLKDFKTDLYTDAIEIPSNPEVLVKLKAMTVEEYKFLTKQLDMFENKIQSIQNEEDTLDQKRRIQLAEIGLNSALDVLLTRCIANQVKVEMLTIYDWVYLLLYLRLVSRGEECKFKIRKGKGKDVTEEYIEFDLSELLDYLIANRERYCSNIIANVPVNEAVSLCVMPITRGDYAYMQKEFAKDANSTLSILAGALSCKAFIRGGVANIMSLPQRVELANNLHYDVINEVMDSYDNNNARFFEVINEFIKSKNEHAEEIDISDFILFFYDF